MIINDTSSNPEPRKSLSIVILMWTLSTLMAAAAMTILLGYATPRVRLLAITPLAIGVAVAAGALWLLIQFGLNQEMQRWMIGWIVVLTVGVTSGSQVIVWQQWMDELKQERIGIRRQIMKLAEQSADPDSMENELRKMHHTFQQRTSFTAYLSHRLEAFASQVGRQNVWSSPIPEVIFLIEEFLAAIAAIFLSVTAYRGEGPEVNEEEAA